MRRCVVPLFANTDSDSDSLVDVDREGLNETHSEESSDNEAAAREEPTDRRAGVRSAETLSDSEDTGAKTKREKFDSGVGDLLESTSARSSPTSLTQSPEADSSVVRSSSAANSSAVEPSVKKTSIEAWFLKKILY